MKIETIDELFTATMAITPSVMEWLNPVLENNATIDGICKKFGSLRIIDSTDVIGEIINGQIDGLIRNCCATTLPMHMVDGSMRGVSFYNFEHIKSFGFDGLLQTMAHEIVHVKQICEGLLCGPLSEWNNANIDASKYNRDINAAFTSGKWECIHEYPWEIEAYGVQYQVAKLLGANISSASDLMRIFYEAYPEYKDLDIIHTIDLAKGDCLSL